MKARERIAAHPAAHAAWVLDYRSSSTEVWKRGDGYRLDVFYDARGALAGAKLTNSVGMSYNLAQRVHRRQGRHKKIDLILDMLDNPENTVKPPAVRS